MSDASVWSSWLPVVTEVASGGTAVSSARTVNDTFELRFATRPDHRLVAWASAGTMNAVTPEAVCGPARASRTSAALCTGSGSLTARLTTVSRTSSTADSTNGIQWAGASQPSPGDGSLVGSRVGESDGSLVGGSGGAGTRGSGSMPPTLMAARAAGPPTPSRRQMRRPVPSQ